MAKRIWFWISINRLWITQLPCINVSNVLACSPQRMALLRQPNIHTPRTHDGNPISKSIESLAIFTSLTFQIFNASLSFGYLTIILSIKNRNYISPCEELAAFATTWWQSCKTHWAQTNTPFLFGGFWKESKDVMNTETLGSWDLWRILNFDRNCFCFCIVEIWDFHFSNSWAIFCWLKLAIWHLIHWKYMYLVTTLPELQEVIGHVMAMWKNSWKSFRIKQLSPGTRKSCSIG